MSNMTLPKTQNCILELKNSWLTIWLNRPEKRNALSEDLIEEIKRTLKSIKDNRSIRGIIFRGKGGVFCAGADLNDLKKIANSGNESRGLALKMSKKVGELFELISKTPQITVSVVEGAAMAGAFGIACTTDFLISMSNAKYALTETKIGLTPAQIAPYVLNRFGFRQGRKLLLMGTIFDGDKGYQMGMVDYLAENDEELNKHIMTIKENVKKCSPNAIAITKEVLFSNYNINVTKAAEYFSDCVIHEEGREGFSSFFEKRKPGWMND